MELIDEEGNLLGTINLIDVLVILLVASVVIAGAAFILGGNGPEPEPDATTYVTLDVGTQPDFVVDSINEGDIYSPSSNAELTVQDMYLTPESGQTRVILQVELAGVDEGGSIEYDGAPPRLGRTIGIITDRYEIDGDIRAVSGEAMLERASTTVVLKDTIRSSEASEITPGDEIQAGGRTVATVENVEAFPTTDPEQRTVFVETTLQARYQRDMLRFGDTPIRSGQSITLPSEDYTITGTIEQRGSLDEWGTADERTVTLRIDEVREDFTEAIRPGMTERVDGEVIAQVTDVDAEPSLLIVTGDDGTVNVRDHPVNRDVTLTADIQVRQTPEGPRFKGDPLRQHQQITFDLGTIVITAEVVSVR